MVRKLAGALLTLSVLDMQSAQALGLGELQLNSSLNQPFDAQLALVNVGELDATQIHIHLANENDFNRAGVERVFFLTDLRFKVEVDGKGGGTLYITSRKLVREPFVNFLIETRWPAGRLLREYTALIDLPLYSDTRSPTQITPAEQIITKTSTLSSDSLVRAGSGQIAVPPAPTIDATAAAPVAVNQATETMGGQYRITKDDTLWSIALRARPDPSVSVQQTMLAIQQLNPEAFFDANINRMKMGYTLDLPSVAEIKRRSREQAIKEIQQQNKGGSAIDGRVIEAGIVDVGRDEIDRQNDVAELRLTSPQQSDSPVSPAQGKSAATDLITTRESLSKSERENAELKAKLAAMADQIADLQSLIELQNARLARLQDQFAQTDAEMLKAQVDAEQSEIQDSLNQAVELAEDLAVLKAPEENTDVEAKEVVAIVEDVAEATPLKSLTPVVAKKSFVDDFVTNPLYWGSAVGLMLLGLLAIRRRQHRQKIQDDIAQESIDDLDLSFEPVLTEPKPVHKVSEVNKSVKAEDIDQGELDKPFADIDADLDASTEKQPGDKLTQVADEKSTNGDVITAVDLFIAFDEYDKALDMLDNALLENPLDETIHLKKLEVLVLKNQPQGFAAHYGVVTSLFGTALLTQVQNLLSGVANAEDWLAEPVINQASVTQSTVIADTGVDENHIIDPVEIIELEDLDDEFDLDLDVDLHFSAQSDLATTASNVDGVVVDDLGGLSLSDDAEPDHLLEPQSDTEEPVLAALGDQDFDFERSDIDVEPQGVSDDLTELDSFDIDVTPTDLSLDSGADDLAAGSTNLDDSEIDLAANSLENLSNELDDNDLAATLSADDLEDVSLQAFDIALDNADLEGLDFEFDGDALNALDVPIASAELEGLEADSKTAKAQDLDLNRDADDLPSLEFDLGDDLAPADTQSQALPSKAEPDELAGFDGLDLETLVDDDDPQLLADSLEALASDLSVDFSIDESADQAASILDAEDECATQLNLASVYIDMGDDNGARGILEDVLVEGNDAQRRQAEELLSRLS